MKLLRAVRIALAAFFFTATVAALFLGLDNSVARLPGRLQILPSAFAATAGVTAVWLVLTFLFGRVYCSTVCPVGAFQDLFLLLRRRIPALNRPFRYRPPRRLRWHVLIVYVVCLVAGIWVIPYLIEPWNIMRNLGSAVQPDDTSSTWATLSMGAVTGVMAGVAGALFLAVSALLTGREFCTAVCPVGTVLGVVASRSVYHIEINPDLCVGCLRCEDECAAKCVKVVSRYVDNATCMRCLRCVARCPESAIRLQPHQNLPATPLMRRRKAGS